MNHAPDADNLDTSAQWSRAVNGTGHYFTRVASWSVHGSDVIGEMQGCVRCGLVIINDRRGVLLIAPGGFNRMHKRIFPCQTPPLCQGPPFCQELLLERNDPLIELRRRLMDKHDPRFRVFTGTLLAVNETRTRSKPALLCR
jgi:hypothetical protein